MNQVEFKICILYRMLAFLTFNLLVLFIIEIISVAKYDGRDVNGRTEEVQHETMLLYVIYFISIGSICTVKSTTRAIETTDATSSQSDDVKDDSTTIKSSTEENSNTTYLPTISNTTRDFSKTSSVTSDFSLTSELTPSTINQTWKSAEGTDKTGVTGDAYSSTDADTFTSSKGSSFSYTALRTNGTIYSTRATNSAQVSNSTDIHLDGSTVPDLEGTTMYSSHDGVKSEETVSKQDGIIATLLVVIIFVTLGLSVFYYKKCRMHTYYVKEYDLKPHDYDVASIDDEEAHETDTSCSVDIIQNGDNNHKIIENPYELARSEDFLNVSETAKASESDIEKDKLDTVYELGKLPFDDEKACINIDEDLYAVVDENEIQNKEERKVENNDTYDDAASVAMVTKEESMHAESCDEYDHVCRNRRTIHLSQDYDYADVNDNTYDEAEVISTAIVHKKRPSYPNKIEENIYEDDPEYSEVGEQENMSSNDYDYSSRSKCVMFKQGSSGGNSGYSNFHIVSETEELYDRTVSFKRMGSDSLNPIFPLTSTNIDENFSDKCEDGLHVSTSNETNNLVSHTFDKKLGPLESHRSGLAGKEQKTENDHFTAETMLLVNDDTDREQCKVDFRFQDDDDLYTLID